VNWQLIASLYRAGRKEPLDMEANLKKKTATGWPVPQIVHNSVPDPRWTRRKLELRLTMVTGWYELIGRSSISCHTQIYTYTNIRINLYRDLYGDSTRHYILTIDELNSRVSSLHTRGTKICYIYIEKVWSHTKLSVQPENSFSLLINTYSFKSFYTCPSTTQMVVKTLSLLWLTLLNLYRTRVLSIGPLKKK